MKKLIFIPGLFLFLSAFSQTVDTALGKHFNFIPLQPLLVPSTWLLTPDSHTLIFDSTKVITVSSGSGAPSSTPKKIGDEYLDITNSKTYKAFGTSSSADWKPLN